MRSTTSPFISLFFLAVSICLISPSSAFFEHLFNQQQAHHQQQQQAPSIKWEDQFSNIQCPTYLCPESLVCVDKPKDCPCPYSDYDKKCLIPGGGDAGKEDTFVCARDCDMVKKALRG
ncbi:hypothetical protein JCM3765_006405 [Sporobolomyces pararoseus]